MPVDHRLAWSLGHAGGGLIEVLLPCWPLIAACLLAIIPAAQIAAGARFLAAAGLVLTLILTPWLSGQDALSCCARILAAAVPLIVWRPEARAARVTVVVTFLSVFCVMLGAGLRPLLPAVALLGIASVLLAVHDAAQAARARAAWDVARLRVAGAILGLLGAAMATGPVAMFPQAQGSATAQAGGLLLAVGLCLLAGLGERRRGSPGGLSGLDALPRLGALTLMLRLPDQDIMSLVLLLAGLVALGAQALADAPEGSGVAPLVTLCAGTGLASAGGALDAALVLLVWGVLMEAPELTPGERGWLTQCLPPTPVFVAAVLLVARLWGAHPFVAVAVVLAIAVGLSRRGGAWPASPTPLFLAGATLGVVVSVLAGVMALGHGGTSLALLWRAA